VHYTGSLDDGTVFDASANRPPLEFTIGEGQLIAGFEQAVIGMNPGESKKVKIPVKDAYGPHSDEMVLVADRKELPEGLDPEVGQMLQMLEPDGGRIILRVTGVTDTSVTLDANHPLAGCDLNFDIELVEIA
jgi:peptidylprolyl isomerase